MGIKTIPISLVSFFYIVYEAISYLLVQHIMDLSCTDSAFIMAMEQYSTQFNGPVCILKGMNQCPWIEYHFILWPFINHCSASDTYFCQCNGHGKRKKARIIGPINFQFITWFIIIIRFSLDGIQVNGHDHDLIVLMGSMHTINFCKQ